ncbi:uncharacterized protein LOC121836331 [Ixodes scapularis]|uniref:uncharacterized protein LOC121836331 n=1 Tax=Ixodes scapularis TaxID=6945 RepID=UPI001C38B0D6|nr:uncharacterized protein LOC121836331 [Ixodes scapularis]
MCADTPGQCCMYDTMSETATCFVTYTTSTKKIIVEDMRKESDVHHALLASPFKDLVNEGLLIQVKDKDLGLFVDAEGSVEPNDIWNLALNPLVGEGQRSQHKSTVENDLLQPQINAFVIFYICSHNKDFNHNYLFCASSFQRCKYREH